MKKNMAFAWLLTVSFTVFAQNSDIKVLADKGQPAGARKTEITMRWNELRPAFSGNDYYDRGPSSKAPYATGKVRDICLQDALDMLNFIRFLAGLPDDVELKNEYTDLAQHGSVLNAAAGTLAHRLSRPADMPEDFYHKASQGIGNSNLGWASFQRPLGDAVISWSDDSDSGNRVHLGHRRWVLNPSMQYTGFGLSGGFSSMYSFDKSRKNPVDYQAIAFPGGAAFPSNFFKAHYAWSLTLNPEIYQAPDADRVTVTLKEKNGGRTWNFSKNGDDFFTVNRSGYGVSNCIIFQPSGINAYSGTYQVEVKGLRDKNGKEPILRYEVAFFPLDTTAMGSIQEKQERFAGREAREKAREKARAEREEKERVERAKREEKERVERVERAKRQAREDAANWDIPRLDTARGFDYLSEMEKDTVLEINKVRSDPSKYARLYFPKTDKIYVKLTDLEPLPPLVLEKGLCLAAREYDGIFERARVYGTYSGATAGQYTGSFSSGKEIAASLLRNSNTFVLDRNYTSFGFSVNSDPAGRSQVTHILANNYRAKP
jgi:hypothetical protein